MAEQKLLDPDANFLRTSSRGRGVLPNAELLVSRIKFYLQNSSGRGVLPRTEELVCREKFYLQPGNVVCSIDRCFRVNFVENYLQFGKSSIPKYKT